MFKADANTVRKSYRAAAAMLSLCVATGGCANFSPDGGMGAVALETGALAGHDAVKIRNEADAAAARARVKALLGSPLSSSSAVEIALLNNRALQAAYNELGITEAKLVEATLPPAPTVSLLRLAASRELEIERQIVQNVLALLTLPKRREIAGLRFAEAQSRAVEATLRTAFEAKRSFYKAVAASQSASYYEQAQKAAEAVSAVAKKLGETGAMSKIDQAREHAFYAEISADLAAARLRADAERERLNRALGLWGEDTKAKLPRALDKLPARAKVLADPERDAITTRVDLEMARIDLEALAAEYGLTHATRFIDVLDVRSVSRFTRSERVVTDVSLAPGPSLVKSDVPETDKATLRGLEVEFKIPIYDFGEARTRLAEEVYMQAVNRLMDKAVNARSEAREAYQTYRGAHDIARHYERDILPLREMISSQQLLSYNGMISDLLDVLAEARLRVMANIKAIDAKRDFWIASVALDAALAGGGAGPAETAGANATAGSVP